MIIEAKKAKEVELRTLDYGEVFGYGEDIFMFMPTISDYEEDQYNVVDLSSGYAEYFCPEIKVVPYPKAKLVIED